MFSNLIEEIKKNETEPVEDTSQAKETLFGVMVLNWDKIFDKLITLIAVAQPVTYFLLKEVGIVDHETTSLTEVEEWLKSGKPVNAIDGDNVLHRFIPDFDRGVLRYNTYFRTEILK